MDDKVQNKNKIAIIFNTATYERVAFMLGLASAQLALGDEVNVLFAHGALIRLKKGLTDQVGDETDYWIREQIKSRTRQGGITSISDLLKDFKKLGGKVYACPAAMTFHNISKAELIDEVVAIRGVVSFLKEETKDASIIYV